jgi:N-acetylglucosaminyldiphosphoundecaprenol N-acetyl-beta-D-mannosaminyltransferase
VYIVNAHTLNLAAESSDYRDILNSADAVFGDGTGVRWAARLRGIRMLDNLVGTDLVPLFMAKTRDEGYRYFLLGGQTRIVEAALDSVGRTFPGLEIAGYHHGHFAQADNADVVRKINATRPDVLLVAMGNPTQERWIHEHRAHLHVGLCVGVGGLVDHWGGALQRAPLWVRRSGLEWLQILLQQPYKWRRYLIGNPKYLVRVTRTLSVDRVSTDRSTA